MQPDTRAATATSGGCSTSRMTRARDWLSVSRHERVTKQAVGPSPYYAELSTSSSQPEDVRDFRRFEHRARRRRSSHLAVTYSELAAFIDCGMAFRLRNLLGFQPRLAPELGYGKAVHHVMRAMAEATERSGAVPTDREID